MTEHTTNYIDTFIAVSPDSAVSEGKVPAKPGTIAAMQYERLAAAPYGLTSDDLLFDIFAERNAIDEADRAEARTTFYSRGQACLRSSPLVKTHGFGLHHDGAGRVALYAVGSAEYEAMHNLKQVPGMRSKRG